MERKFHSLTLSLTGKEKKNMERQSRKVPALNNLGYMKDDIMATAEGCEKKIFEGMKFFYQKIAMNFAMKLFRD